MAQSLSELIGQGAEKLGGWGLDTGSKAKKKLSEIADIAMANDTRTAGDKVTAIGQSLSQGGGALLGDVGKAVDTVNPLNYAPKLFGSDKTLSEQGYGAEKLLSNVGKVPGNVITSIGEGGTALADAVDKTQRVFGGDISVQDYGVVLTKDLLKIGASGIQSVFAMAAPLIQPIIGTAFDMTGADKLLSSGREASANKIMETFGVPDNYKKDVKEGLNSAFDIATAYAGLKGAKVMGRQVQAKVGSKALTNVDGSPMMVPAAGLAKTANVAKGMLTASAPDIGMAIVGSISSNDSPGAKIGKTIASSLLSMAANHPAVGAGMFKEKSKLTDSELQAKNDEAIKADGEAVSKSEKSLSQIALDQADKRNGESKTLGVMTPDLMKEYRQSKFPGSMGDWLKSIGKVETSIGVVEDIAPKAEAIEETKPTEGKVIPQNYDLPISDDTFRGTSFDPEKRAKSVKDGYRKEMEELYADLSKLADTPEKKAILDSEIKTFEDRYRRSLLDMYGTQSRIVSSMITGPAKFPTERMRKLNDSAHKKSLASTEIFNNGVAAIKKKLKGEDATGLSPLEAMKRKLAIEKGAHANAKKLSEIARSKATIEEKIARAKEVYGKEELAETTMEFLRQGKKLPSFILTNSNARIKDMESRVAQLEKKETAVTEEKQIGDARIVYNTEADRVQIEFPGKPSLEMINSLKSRGFKWSPSNGVWQRQLTENAKRDASEIVSSGLAKEASAKTEETTVVTELPKPTLSELATVPTEKSPNKAKPTLSEMATESNIAKTEQPEEVIGEPVTETVPAVEESTKKRNIEDVANASKLPKGLEKGGGWYKTHMLVFPNDLYKALYIVRESSGKRSGSDTKYLGFVMDTLGVTEEGARKLGDYVLADVKKSENSGAIDTEAETGKTSITVNSGIFDRAIQEKKALKATVATEPKKPTLSEIAEKTEPAVVPKEEPTTMDIGRFITSFKLPKGLEKGGGGYRNFTIDFSNDFNKALYIIRESHGARSKSDAKYLDTVMKQTGLDEDSARKLGDTVLENIKLKEGNGDIQDNTITVDANLFGGKTPTVAKAEPVVLVKKIPASQAVIPNTEPATTISKAIAPKTEPVITPEPIVVPVEKAPKKTRTPKSKPTLSELATTPEPTITTDPTPEGDLPFETKTPKPDLSNNLVNDAVINEESRNKTSGRFEVTTLPGKIGAYLSEKGGRLLSLGAYLNKIKVILDNGKRVPFNTYIDSVRSSAINMANGIIDRYGIRKMVNALPDPGDVKVGNDALIGAVTPMGTVITDKNTSIVKDILKDITRLRFDHLGFNNKKLAKINALGYIWRINQSPEGIIPNPRQAIIDKYVTKEYQDFFKAINDETGLARKVYDDAGNVLIERKALTEKDDSEIYTRFILSETGKKFMRKHGVKYELIIDPTSPNAKTIEYDSVEDLRKAMGMYAAQGIPFTDKTVKNFESILKEKGGAEIDIFRIHSPLAQLLDYSGHFGKLVADIEVVKKFGELQKEKDPAVQDYTAKMTTSENFANPIEQVLNINRAAKGVGEKISQGLGNIARTQLLYASVKNLVQGMTSAQLRRAMYSSGLVKGQAGKFTDYKNADNEMVQSRLHGEGFLTNYELLPGAHSPLKDQLIWWSSAGENSAKTHIALSGMEQVLKDNKVAYEKNDALSITDKFQEWASNPVNRDRAIEIKSDIKQNNNTVSDVSSMARSQVPFMQRFGFGSMKTYGIGQVTQNLQDLGTIVDRVVRPDKVSGEQAHKAISRAAVQFGGYVMVATIASAVWKSTQPEPKDEEEKKELDRQAEAIGNAVGGQAYGNPIATFKNLFTGILSNTGLAPVQAAADIAQVLAIFGSNDKESYRAGLNELVRSTLKNSAIGKTIDMGTGILSEKSLQKIFAESLGSVNRENQTRAGMATGKKTDSRSEFVRNLLGYNTDNAIEQMVYKEFEKSKIAQQYGLDRKSIPVEMISLVTKIFSDNARSLGQPGKIWEGVTKYNDNVIEQQYVANVVNASREVKSFEDLTASIVGAPKGLYKAREDIKKANDTYEKILGETWITFGIDNNLPLYDKLEILRTKNPVAYNNTVAGLAKSLKYMSNIKDGTAKFSQEEDMKAMYASDPNVDAAISELNGTAPNSVAAIEQINSGLSNFQRDIGTIGIEGAKKKFAEVEAMNKILNGVSLYSDTYEKALANGTFQYDGAIKAMEDNGYKDFKKDFPITTELIHRGLILRGETELKPTAGKFPTDNGTIGTGVSNQPSSAPIKTNLNYVGTPKKPKLSELALMKPTQVAPKPLFNPLAQPMEGSLLQMAMRRK